MLSKPVCLIVFKSWLTVLHGVAGEHDTLKIELSPDQDLPTESPASSAAGSAANATLRKVLLVPFVRAIVTAVDVRKGFLSIDPPAGLLDLAAVPKQPKVKRSPALGNIRSSESKRSSSGKLEQ